jgi:hypothetical protein
MSQSIYILMRGDERKPSLSDEGLKIVGVVSDSKVADRFYSGQTPGDKRDVFMFPLDEVPELSGIMGGSDIPEPVAAPPEPPTAPPAPAQARPAVPKAPSAVSKEQWDELKEVRRQQQLQSIELQKRLDLLKKRRGKSL